MLLQPRFVFLFFLVLQVASLVPRPFSVPLPCHRFGRSEVAAAFHAGILNRSAPSPLGRPSNTEPSASMHIGSLPSTVDFAAILAPYDSSL